MSRFDPNVLAGVFAHAARIGLASPPVWDGCKGTVPVLHPENGACLGHVLPGRGFALAADLHRLGITRPIPGVFERSPVWRTRDKLQAWMKLNEGMPLPLYDYRGVLRSLADPDLAVFEMLHVSPAVLAAKSLAAAITTYDGIITARGGGKANDLVFAKVSATTVAQAFSTVFGLAGLPVAGTYTNIPGGAVHTRASTGALNSLWNPTNPDKKYLLTFGFGSSSAIDWGVLVDLLVGCGNISCSITTSQTVNSVAQTRQYENTLGAGVMASLHITTALGTGTGTSTLTSYTDQDGNIGAASGTITSVASAILHRVFPTSGDAVPWVPLASGDYGVRSVETFAFSAAHSAGVAALNLVYPLSYVPGIAANLYVERDSTTQVDGFRELVADGSFVVGCLTMFVQTNSTSSGTLRGFVRTAAG